MTPETRNCAIKRVGGRLLVEGLFTAACLH